MRVDRSLELQSTVADSAHFHHQLVTKAGCDSAVLGMCMEFPSQRLPSLAEAPFQAAWLCATGDTLMNKVDLYKTHARDCMDRAARSQRAEDKRQWLQMADVWLDMIPERQPTAADNFDAAMRNQRADQERSTAER
jgi:hypothetical protein